MAEQRRFAERNAPLYLSLPELRELDRRVQARLDWEAGRELDLLDEAEDSAPLAALTPADIPSALGVGLIERSGALGPSVLVFPKVSQALWDGSSLTRFVSELREVARGPRSSPPTPCAAARSTAPAGKAPSSSRRGPTGGCT